MPDNRFTHIAEGVFINGLYDTLKSVLNPVLGGAVIALGVAVWRIMKHVPIDWWGILALFVFVCIVFAFLMWLHRQGHRQQQNLTFASDPEPLHPANAGGYLRSKTAVSQLSPLQREALDLSARLLGFITELGDPPQPKYTVEQIQNMGSEKVKQLIIAKDKDFDFACEYHFGGHDDIGYGTNTSEKLANKIMARITLLDPWYERVRARYELEFKAEVERLYNRFCVEALCENKLMNPVQGRKARETVRDIAATLWELAFKLKEKEVIIKQDI